MRDEESRSGAFKKELIESEKRELERELRAIRNSNDAALLSSTLLDDPERERERELNRLRIQAQNRNNLSFEYIEFAPPFT